VSDFVFGKSRSKKERKREQLARNAEVGRFHQNSDRLEYDMRGYHTIPRRTGLDFEATRYDYYTGRTEHLYVESKSSATAPLTEAQERMREKKGSHYRVRRPPSI